MNAATAIATAIDRRNVRFDRVYDGDGNGVFRIVTPCSIGGNFAAF
jgi:hypothetical protein